MTSSIPHPDPESVPELIDDPDALLQWIRHAPQLAKPLKRLRDGKDPYPPIEKNFAQKAFWFLRMLLICDPQELRGSVIVNEAVKKDAQVTARIITISNVLDGFLNLPLFVWALGSTPVGWVSSILLTVGLLKFGNDACTTVARGRAQNKAWSRFPAFIAMIPLALLKTFSTGVGTELLNNRSTLVQYLARDVVEVRLRENEQAITLEGQVTSPTYQAAKTRCEAGEADLKKLDHENPIWNSIYVQINGPWSERNKDWSTVPLAALPHCRVVTRLEFEATERYNQARTDHLKLLRERQTSGNDVSFLQTHFPKNYDLAISQGGDFRSGVTAVTYALTHFSSQLMNGRWNQLGLSIFLLLISLLSSTLACYLVIALSLREDVQMSWDPSLRAARELWFQGIFTALHKQHLQEEEQEQAAQEALAKTEA